jgi:hypothetical protein
MRARRVQHRDIGLRPCRTYGVRMRVQVHGNMQGMTDTHCMPGVGVRATPSHRWSHSAKRSTISGTVTARTQNAWHPHHFL